MADMSLPTIIDSNSGFGGAGLGAGFIGGLVLGSIWNGGFGGWGRGNAGNAVADASLANAVEHVSDQVTQGTISNLQSASTQNMFMGNLLNQTGDQITAAVNQGTVSGMQNTAQISEKLCCINNNITSQGYENRLQAQSLASQLAQQHADLSRQIFEQGCANRELQRDIQAQAVRDQLAQAQAQNAALTAQINLTNQLTAQTAYLIQQLGGDAAATRTTSAG